MHIEASKKVDIVDTHVPTFKISEQEDINLNDDMSAELGFKAPRNQKFRSRAPRNQNPRRGYSTLP